MIVEIRAVSSSNPLPPLPPDYRNDSLGVDMQIAAGLYGEVESFPGGVRIVRHHHHRTPVLPCQPLQQFDHRSPAR